MKNLLIVLLAIVFGVAGCRGSHGEHRFGVQQNVTNISQLAGSDGQYLVSALAPGAQATELHQPLVVIQAPQSVAPDQACAITVTTSNIQIDAGCTFSTGTARRMWLPSACTFCGEHLNDTGCICYAGGQQGSYIDGLWTVVCSSDAGTTCTTVNAEK